MPSWEYFDRPASAVESNLSAMNQRADAALNAANAAISNLGDVDFPVELDAPNIIMPEVVVPSPVTPVPPDVSDFGSVSQFITPVFEDLSALLDISLASLLADIPVFSPTSGTINIPAAPAPIDLSGLPTRPDTDEVTIPEAPTFVMPDLEALTSLSIPDFTFPELPTFDDVAPTFTDAAPNTNLVWAEAVYESDLLDDTTAKVRAWLQGGTGLPPAVQQALFDMARGRESMTAREARELAFDVIAGRGFSMPPGMLAEMVEVANEKSRFAQNEVSRTILVESAKWEIENIRFAVGQGIGLETVLIGKFNSSAQRAFEAARHRVDADIALFNALVSLYNARQSGYRVAADVFKIKVEAALAELQVFRAQIDAEIAKGQLNEQKVRAFEARLKAVTATVEIYRSRMEGARVQSEVVKSQLEGYRIEVDAYGKRVDADAKRFDVFESQVRAEGVRGQVFEAESRAFAETVRAASDKANIKMKWVDSRIAALRASNEKFLGMVQAERDRVSSSATAIQATAQAFSADVGRYTAEIQGQNTASQVGLSVSELRLRNNIARFEAEFKTHDSRLNRMVEIGKVMGAQLDAAAKAAAALAQGALSAIHVQASMSGQGDVSDRQTYNVNINRKGADVA